MDRETCWKIRKLDRIKKTERQKVISILADNNIYILTSVEQLCFHIDSHGKLQYQDSIVSVLPQRFGTHSVLILAGNLTLNNYV